MPHRQLRGHGRQEELRRRAASVEQAGPGRAGGGSRQGEAAGGRRIAAAAPAASRCGWTCATPGPVIARAAIVTSFICWHQVAGRNATSRRWQSKINRVGRRADGRGELGRVACSPKSAATPWRRFCPPPCTDMTPATFPPGVLLRRARRAGRTVLERRPRFPFWEDPSLWSVLELTRELITSHGGAAADEIRNPNVPNRQLHQSRFSCFRTSGWFRTSDFGFRASDFVAGRQNHEMIGAISRWRNRRLQPIVYERSFFVSWNRMVP